VTRSAVAATKSILDAVHELSFKTTGSMAEYDIQLVILTSAIFGTIFKIDTKVLKKGFESQIFPRFDAFMHLALVVASRE
jgi:hypothetical protein